MGFIESKNGYPYNGIVNNISRIGIALTQLIMNVIRLSFN